MSCQGQKCCEAARLMQKSVDVNVPDPKIHKKPISISLPLPSFKSNLKSRFIPCCQKKYRAVVSCLAKQLTQSWLCLARDPEQSSAGGDFRGSRVPVCQSASWGRWLQVLRSISVAEMKGHWFSRFLVVTERRIMAPRRYFEALWLLQTKVCQLLLTLSSTGSKLCLPLLNTSSGLPWATPSLCPQAVLQLMPQPFQAEISPTTPIPLHLGSRCHSYHPDPTLCVSKPPFVPAHKSALIRMAHGC